MNMSIVAGGKGGSRQNEKVRVNTSHNEPFSISIIPPTLYIKSRYPRWFSLNRENWGNGSVV